MKFSEFKNYRPKSGQNVFVFICEDDFLVEESRAVWLEIFAGDWLFEKMQAKEFQEIETNRLMDDALTPSLFSQSKAYMVMNGEKLSKARIEDLAALQKISRSSVKVILCSSSLRSAESLLKLFSGAIIEPPKPADVVRWLMDRFEISAEIARHVVESVGTELFLLNNEMEKLKTYAGSRPVAEKDVDTLILRSERFGPFELDDALLERDYQKAVLVVGAMLEEGMEPLMVLARIIRIWRQLLIGKGLASKRGASEVAAAAGVPAWKSGAFLTACRKYPWKQLAGGFRELLHADRAFKTSSPNVGAYFDVMLWKLVR